MSSKYMEVSEENLEDLLTYDDVFLDYFNSFLASNAFPVPLYYDRLTGTIHEHDLDSSASVYKSPRARYGASDEETERVLTWVKNDRLPLFLATKYYLEYKLCRQLIRPLEARRQSEAAASSGIRGYSRQTESGSESSFVNSTSKSYATHNEDLWPEIRYSAFKYLRPGSRAFSLPISMMRNTEQDSMNINYDDRSHEEKKNIEDSTDGDWKTPAPKTPGFRASKATHGPKGILKSGGLPKNKAVKLSSKVDKVRTGENRSEEDDGLQGEPVEELNLPPSTGEGEKSQVMQGDFEDEDSMVGYNSDYENSEEDAIKSAFEETQRQDTNESLKYKGRTTSDKRRTTLQQFKEEFIGSRDGMESFKLFLMDTSGGDLINFWLDCEQFKDEMEQFEDYDNKIVKARMFRQAFREIQDKYKLKLTPEARAQIQRTAQHDGLSFTMFTRTQYDALRRIRVYWVPRYIAYRERVDNVSIPTYLRGLSIDTKSKPSTTERMEEDINRNKIYEEDSAFEDDNENENFKHCSVNEVNDFSIHPYLDVSQTLPIKSDNIQSILHDPLQTWSTIKKSGKTPASRIKSAVNRTADEWHKYLNPTVERYIVGMLSDKSAGGPFQRYLQRKCLQADDVKSEMLVLAKFLFWQDVMEFISSDSKTADRVLRRSNAWSIFNKYFNPENMWYFQTDQDLCQSLRNKLQSQSDTFDATIFNDIKEQVEHDLQAIWNQYNSEDLELFLQWRGHADGVEFPFFYNESEHGRSDEKSPIVRRYPGSTESQLKRKRQRELLLTKQKADAEKELDDHINAEPKRKKGQKMKYRNQFRKQEAETEDMFLQAMRDRQQLNEKESVAETTIIKKEREKTALKLLTLADVIKRDKYYNDFIEYAEIYEIEDTKRNIELYKMLENYFEKEDNDASKTELEEICTEIVANFMTKTSVKRVDLPRNVTIRENKPTSARLKLTQAFIEPIVDEACKCYLDGKIFSEKFAENPRKWLEDGVPPMWKERKILNGLEAMSVKKMAVKLPPTEESCQSFELALENPNVDRLSAQLHGLYTYLKAIRKVEANPLLPTNLLFVIEVQRLRDLVHKDRDDILVRRKIEGILGIYFDSFIEPKLQLEIGTELAGRIVRQGQAFLENKYYSDITCFIEGCDSLFKKLAPYWTAFIETYTDPSPSERTRSAILLDREMEERFHRWQARSNSPQLIVPLPRTKPPSSQYGSALSFSVSDGLKWKELSNDEVAKLAQEFGGPLGGIRTAGKLAQVSSRSTQKFKRGVNLEGVC